MNRPNLEAYRLRAEMTNRKKWLETIDYALTLEARLRDVEKKIAELREKGAKKCRLG